MEISENLNQSFINLMNIVDDNKDELLKKIEEENIPENYYTKKLPIEINKDIEISGYDILRLIKEHTENFNIEFLIHLKQAIIDWGDEFIDSYSCDLLSLLKEKNEEKTKEIESKLLDIFSNNSFSYGYKVYGLFFLIGEYIGYSATNKCLKEVQKNFEVGGVTRHLITNVDKILEEIDNKINIETSEPDTDPIDLSDTDTKTKLAMLDELGILDYIREKQPFSTSTNAVASLFSAILGVKAGTLQPSLNAMINKETVQRNAPTEKHYTKARLKLTELGYMPKEN